MFNNVVFALFLLTLPKISHTACHGSKTSYSAQFMGSYTLDDQVLIGHVFAMFSVKNFHECYSHCDGDCKCRSFNLPKTGEGQCELNSADNDTVLTKPRRGWRYHHLKVEQVKTGADSCYEPYSNGCCDKVPCKNDRRCTETDVRGKPGFNCECTETHTGPMCERKISSCFDYLWHDKNASSGMYKVWDNEKMREVYCEMRPDKLEAWTLVMSYYRDNSADFINAPFSANSPQNGAVNSGKYRLHVDVMKSLKKGMEDGKRKVEWRATCGYSFDEKRQTSDDVVRSSFETLDLFTFRTSASNCRRVDYIKIRGRECYNCNVWATQTNNEIFSINAYYGDRDCNFKSHSTVHNEHIFGVYKAFDAANHACAKSNDAATQYWFGGIL